MRNFVTRVNKKTMKKTAIITQLLSLLAILLLPACGKGSLDEAGSIFPTTCELQAGDVVFRQGIGFESDVVMLAQGPDAMYSHCGIVTDSAGVMMIVHAVPDEPDFDGDVNRVKMDRPERFYMASRASRGEVMRCDDPTVAQVAARQALAYYRRHTLFNDDYDDADTTRLYCTQLVRRAYAAAGVELPTGEAMHFAVPGIFDVRCILPAQLRECGYFRSVARFEAKKAQRHTKNP